MGAARFRAQSESSTACGAEGLEDGVHADFFDFTDMGHEFAEASFGEAALLEPCEVFLGEIHERNAGGRVGLDAEFSEGHVGVADFGEESAEVFAVDFGEGHGM